MLKDTGSLRFIDILGRSINLLLQNFLPILGVTLVCCLFALGGFVLVFYNLYGSIFIPGFEAESLTFTWSLFFTVFGGILLILLPFQFLSSFVCRYLSSCYLEKELSFKANLKKSLAQSIPLLGVWGGVTLLLLLGFCLFLVPGIILALGLHFVFLVFILEEKSPQESLSRSWDLTRFWRFKIGRYLFLYLLILLLLVLLGTAAIGMIGAFFQGILSFQIIVFALTLLFLYIIPPYLFLSFNIVLYYNIRSIKEGFFLEQLTEEFDLNKAVSWEER